MNLAELKNNLSLVSDLYAKRFAIERSSDWYLLKIQEELGELSSAYLKLSGRARTGEINSDELKKNLQDEIADLLAMTILFAKDQGIDPCEAIEQKWYKHLSAAKGEKLEATVLK